MHLIKSINSGINTLLYYSFYLRAGKEQVYIRCFDNDEWLRCSTSVGFDKNNRVQRLKILASSERKQNTISNKPIVKTLNPFDHPRLVYNQFENAEKVIRYLLNYFKNQPNSNGWKMVRCIIFQLNYEPEGGITDVEKRMILDSLLHSGAKLALVTKPSTIVSEDQIEKLYTYIVENRIRSEDQIKGEFKKLLI